MGKIVQRFYVCPFFSFLLLAVSLLFIGIGYLTWVDKTYGLSLLTFCIGLPMLYIWLFNAFNLFKAFYITNKGVRILNPFKLDFIAWDRVIHFMVVDVRTNGSLILTYDKEDKQIVLAGYFFRSWADKAYADIMKYRRRSFHKIEEEDDLIGGQCCENCHIDLPKIKPETNESVTCTKCKTKYFWYNCLRCNVGFLFKNKIQNCPDCGA